MNKKILYLNKKFKFSFLLTIVFHKIRVLSISRETLALYEPPNTCM